MGDEQRQQIRIQSEIRVAYRTVGSFLSDYAVNISKGGVFIQTDNPLPVGALVRLVFSLPGVPVLFDVSAKVKWCQMEFEDEENLPGMGVEFLQLDPVVRKRIEAHVKRMENEMPEVLRDKPKLRPRIEITKLSGSAPQRDEVTQRDARPLGERESKK